MQQKQTGESVQTILLSSVLSEELWTSGPDVHETPDHNCPFSLFLSALFRKSVRGSIFRRAKSSRQTRRTTRRTAGVRSADNSTCTLAQAPPPPNNPPPQ